MRKIFFSFLFIIIFIIPILIIINSGCANIIPPGGGPKDTLPPVLVNATPRDSLTNFTSNKIVLTFDEYVQLENLQDNLIVSPNPQNPPQVDSKLRTVTIRLKDTLQPNTTYSINFGNALKDINEGNIDKNFTYVFSTGKHLDENTLNGKVLLAETGKVDSTLIVVLHKNLADSAVEKERPLYYARLDSKGNFQFRNLPAATFAVYTLPNDYSKRYDDSTKLFAFLNEPVKVGDTFSTPKVTLYAYQEVKEAEKKQAAPTSLEKNKKPDKYVRITTNLEQNQQDLLSNLELTFNKKLPTIDTNKIILADTNYKPINGINFLIDTSRTKLTIKYNWPENTDFRLVIQKDAIADSAGSMLAKADTVKFSTKRESDYGSIRLRFPDLDLSKNPVLQLVKNNVVVDSAILTTNEWYKKLYTPGDYEIRILFDDNKNGTWDPGKFFGVHKQPEIVQSISTPLKIKANWDNEQDVYLTQTQPTNKKQNTINQ
ncbi:MAG: Ig-like domain-containing protein [Chitinophagaceae bacterium]